MAKDTIADRGRSLIQGFSAVLGTSVKASLAGPSIARFMLAAPFWTQRNFEDLADEGFVRNAIAYRCVTLIAGSAAAIPFILTDKTGKQIDEHPVLDLLNAPNPLRKSQAAFMGDVYSDRLLAGESFIEGTGIEKAIGLRRKGKAPLELYSLRPDRMIVTPGPQSVPLKFIHRVGQDEIPYEVDQLTGDSAILHSKNYHPLNDWRGLSPIEAAAYAIDQHNASGEWNAAQLQNSGQPSMAVTYQAPTSAHSPMLGEEGRAQVRKQVDDELKGPSNAGRIAILGTALKFHMLSQNAQEMDWLKGREGNAKEIALAFGVPEQLVGVTGSQTYANYEQARLALYDDAVLPLASSYVDDFNDWLVPRFDEGLKLGLDLDEVEALAPRRKDIWDRVANADFLMLDEKREAVGYEPLKGGAGQVIVTRSGMPSAENFDLNDGGEDDPIEE